jgi:hypothetical protein
MRSQDAFFIKLLETNVGHFALMVAVGKLRPALEPIATKQGLLWEEDVVPVLELIDSSEEIEAAMGDPAAFMDCIKKTAGPAAKKLEAAHTRVKLQPVLEARLQAKGLAWEDAIIALRCMEEPAELKEGLLEPAAFVEKLLGPTGPKQHNKHVEIAISCQGLPGVAMALPCRP